MGIMFICHILYVFFSTSAFLKCKCSLIIFRFLQLFLYCNIFINKYYCSCRIFSFAFSNSNKAVHINFGIQSNCKTEKLNYFRFHARWSFPDVIVWWIICNFLVISCIILWQNWRLRRDECYRKYGISVPLYMLATQILQVQARNCWSCLLNFGLTHFWVHSWCLTVISC